MRKLLFLLLALWCSGRALQAKQVPAETAQVVAQNFIKSFGDANSRVGLELRLVHQEASKATSAGNRTTPTTFFYVFNIGEEQGMIFVAGDDKVVPILGYTDAGSFDRTKMPPHFIKWLEYYKNEIRYAIENLPEDAANLQKWSSLMQEGTGAAAKTSTAAAVNPLIATKWNQNPYYNQLCPYDQESGQNTVTGCVATAMAQIMRYWKYPEKGSGFHSYNHERYGTLSANFSSTTYDWNNMPLQLTSNNTAVATLMQHAGISVDMNYDIASRGGSGAYVITAASPVQHCSEYALKTYFGYREAQGVLRANYTLSNWITMLKQQLDAGQPILYAGFGGGGGHAFVCDGYNNEDMFHMNWGWGGYADGYFAITALNPAGVGTGGGTGGFNSGHQAVINIKAPQTPTQAADLQLYDHVSLSAQTIYFTQGFHLKTNIINKGTGSFTGDYAAAAFDEEGNFVDFIASYTNNTLPANYYYTNGVTFATDGMVSLLPGKYTLAVFYKSGNGQWQQLLGGGYTSVATLEVIYPNDLELASTFNVNSGGDLHSGGNATVQLNVQNDGNTAFNGVVDVSLYNLDGSWAYTIEEKANVQICSGCKSPNLTFSNSQLAVEPGTYLMAVLYHQAGSNQWELGGSTYYSNPIKVIVKTAPLVGDSYENNDEADLAYLLPIVYSNTEQSTATNGATIHIGTDYDFYKLMPPADGNYRIRLRVHDSYNSDDNSSYSNDVLFSYSTDGGNSWSDVYDDVMPSDIDVEGGQSLIIFVASYFQGETGTYKLQANARRATPNGIEDPAASKIFAVYPNPTRGMISIEAKQNFDLLEVMNLTGKVVKQVKGDAVQLDLSSLPSGMYLLRAKSGAEMEVKKVIKQ